MSISLRLHAFVPHSRANGPGSRAVIWVQGCSLGCPGCFNPLTHDLRGGESIAPEDLVRRVVSLGDSVQGITISGGEPLQQLPAVTEFVAQLRAQSSLSIIVFTGFTWEEAGGMREARRLLACADVLIAGRYDASQRLARGLRGSANKTVHFLTDRYGLTDFEAIPEAEIVIAPGGDIFASGIGPLRLD